MRARDVMTTPVVTVRPTSTIKDAAALLTRHGFTALPVVDDDSRLLGMVSEADVIDDRIPPDPRNRAGRGNRAGHALPPETVGYVMTAPIVAVAPSMDVADLAVIMLRSNHRRVPIVEDGRLVGIVTRRDLLRTIARDDASIAADVRHKLEIYGGRHRWRVTVHGGLVDITDALDSETDRHVATVLAESVPGVVRARTAAKGEQ